MPSRRSGLWQTSDARFYLHFVRSASSAVPPICRRDNASRAICSDHLHQMTCRCQSAQPGKKNLSCMARPMSSPAQGTAAAARSAAAAMYRVYPDCARTHGCEHTGGEYAPLWQHHWETNSRQPWLSPNGVCAACLCRSRSIGDFLSKILARCVHRGVKDLLLLFSVSP